MRWIAGLSGLTLIAALSACAPTSGLPQISLLGGGEAASPAAGGPATAEAVVVAGAPPLPVRNEGKRRNQPGAKLAAGSPEKEEKQASLALPGLPEIKIFTATAYAPDQAHWEQAPVSVYTQLAQQIRACWFTPGSSKLTKHGFHAEVSPDDANNAKIIIYEKDPEGRRGVQAFRINISAGLGGSTVQSENRRLDKDLDLAFKSDLVRWSKGEQTCKS